MSMDEVQCVVSVTLASDFGPEGRRPKYEDINRSSLRVDGRPGTKTGDWGTGDIRV